VNESLRWFEATAASSRILALGVDTMLTWAGAKAGLRAVDKSLQKRFPASEKSVLGLNSLYGAMCAGGPLLALRMRAEYPTLPIFETHPKILYCELSGCRYDWKGGPDRMLAEVAARLGISSERCEVDGEDEFDAALSALAAFFALRGEWKFDLYELPHAGDDELYWVVPGAKYPWPVPVDGFVGGEN
jgi:hypothetical protein